MPPAALDIARHADGLVHVPRARQPSGPAVSRRASHPESATMPCMMSASATFPTCSDARRIRLAHAASAGETARPDATFALDMAKSLVESPPARNTALLVHARGQLQQIIGGQGEQLAREHLEQRRGPLRVRDGLRQANHKRHLGGAVEDGTAGHHARQPSARSASAYTFARPMPPSSTTMSPGLCPAAANPENDFATRRAATAAASADVTPRDGVTVTCTCTRGPSGRNGRLTLDSARPGANDMNSAPNTCGCSKMRSHSANTSPWLRKLSGSSMMPSGLRRRTSSRWRRYTDTSAPRNR